MRLRFCDICGARLFKREVDGETVYECISPKHAAALAKRRKARPGVKDGRSANYPHVRGEDIYKPPRRNGK